MVRAPRRAHLLTGLDQRLGAQAERGRVVQLIGLTQRTERQCQLLEDSLRWPLLLTGENSL